MSSVDSNQLKDKFYKWCFKAQYEFLESELFQPVGLELSCVNIIIETNEDYFFNGIKETEINEENFPLAYYNPVDDSIHIYVEHKSFRIRTSEEEQYAFLMFLLFHEANHRLLIHVKRSTEKDLMLWNIAGDMEIHNMFYVYLEIMKNENKYNFTSIYNYSMRYINKFLFEKNDKEKSEGLWEKEYLQYTAEEIYADLMNSKVEKSTSYSLNSNNDENDENNNVVVTVATYTTKSNKKITSTTINFPDYKYESTSNSDKENGALTRKTLMENNLQKKIDKCLNSKSKGDFSSECLKFLKKILHVKIDWKKILRNSLQTTLEKNEYFSWAKIRTSLFGLYQETYLPGQIEEETGYGTVIISCDESGSISDKDREKAAGIILDAKEYYKKIVVLKHDAKITSVEEITEFDNEDFIKKIALNRNSFGGTSHKDVFEFIKNYEKNNEDDKISCCIFITDMISDIEKTQNIIPDYIPRIWLTPYTENESLKSIKGKIISIEK